MKGLSLYQPWASLMAIGAKTIETRGRRLLYRGPLAIQAAKQFGGHERGLCELEPFRTALANAGLTAASLPLGAVLCVVDLYDVLPTAQSLIGQVGLWPSEPERSFGNYAPGRYAYLTRNLRPLATPVPWRGSQGLFDVPDEILA